jgi:Family of unknown function (DUF6293)
LVILIAPIGIKTDHIKIWLREEKRSIYVLWLIISKKDEKTDFPGIAKKLEEDLTRSYDGLIVKRRVIDDPLSVDPTIDAIYQIILDEEQNDPSLIRKDFAVNITGGTNAMGAAALLSATLFGTKAYYVRHPQKDDPRGKTYVDELPVLPIGTAKLNKNQLQVLKVISERYYEIEGGPDRLDKRRINGSIARRKLIEKLGWDKPVRDSKFSRKEANTRLLGITKKLVEAGLINKIPFTEKYVNTAARTKTTIKDGYVTQTDDNNIHENWIIAKNDKEVRFEVTPAGKRQARNAFMFLL